MNAKTNNVAKTTPIYTPVLELTRKTNGFTFYRYRIADTFTFWFEQRDDGDIYVVYIAIDESARPKVDNVTLPLPFELFVRCPELDDSARKNNKKLYYYPTMFEIRPRSPFLHCEDVEQYMNGLKFGYDVLSSIKFFFEHGEPHIAAFGADQKKYSVECFCRNAEMISRAELPPCSDDYVGDYIIAENEEMAISFAIDCIAEECRKNIEPGQHVESTENKVVVYDDETPMWEYYNFTAKLVED